MDIYEDQVGRGVGKLINSLPLWCAAIVELSPFLFLGTTKCTGGRMIDVLSKMGFTPGKRHIMSQLSFLFLDLALTN